MDGFLMPLTVATALGCGLNAGAFFAFSSFVMKALGRLPAAAGVQAMQAINMAALRSWFFFTAVAVMVGCLLLAPLAVATWHERWAPYLLIGSGMYVVGSMAVTMAFNLTRNDALARLDPMGREAAERWPGWLTEWTFWNSVRAAGALAASAVLTAAALLG